MILWIINTEKSKISISRSLRHCCLWWVSQLCYCNVMQTHFVTSFWSIVLRMFLNWSCAFSCRHQVDNHSLLIEFYSQCFHQLACKKLYFLAATKQLYEWFSPSVRPSVCLSVRLSVCHTFLTMFPSSYHLEIVRSYYQWQKWRPCKRSRSEVKGQGHRGHDPT